MYTKRHINTLHKYKERIQVVEQACIVHRHKARCQSAPVLGSLWHGGQTELAFQLQALPHSGKTPRNNVPLQEPALAPEVFR